MFPAVKLGRRGMPTGMPTTVREDDAPVGVVPSHSTVTGGSHLHLGKSMECQQILNSLKKKLKARHVTAGQLFRMMDADRSNNLTREEFQRGLAMSGIRPVPPLEDVQALYDSLDVDKSRGISFEELHAALESPAPAPTSSDLAKAKGRLPAPRPAPVKTNERPCSPGWEITPGPVTRDQADKDGWAVQPAS